MGWRPAEAGRSGQRQAGQPPCVASTQHLLWPGHTQVSFLQTLLRASCGPRRPGTRLPASNHRGLGAAQQPLPTSLLQMGRARPGQQGLREGWSSPGQHFMQPTCGCLLWRAWGIGVWGLGSICVESVGYGHESCRLQWDRRWGCHHGIAHGEHRLLVLRVPWAPLGRWAWRGCVPAPLLVPPAPSSVCTTLLARLLALGACKLGFFFFAFKPCNSMCLSANTD